MKKLFRVLVLSAITTVAMAAFSGYSQTNTSTNMMPKMKGGATGFRAGKVESVDLTAKTITIKNKTIGERVLMQDSATVLMLDGQPATLSDIKAGYYGSGSLHVVGTNEYIVQGKFTKEKPMRGTTAPSTNSVPKAPAQ
jgi:Cu/Ag efflux protein CusF